MHTDNGYGIVFIGFAPEADKERALAVVQELREASDILVETRLRPKQVMTRYPLSFDDAQLLMNRFCGLGLRCYLIDLSPVSKAASGVSLLGLLLVLSIVCNFIFSTLLFLPSPFSSEPQKPAPAKTAHFALGGDLFEYNGADYTSYILDVDETDLRIFWKDDNGQTLSNFANLSKYLESKGQSLVFATNAGIFDPNFRPVGVFIENGRERVPLDLGTGYGNFYMKPNGVFYITENRVGVVASEDFLNVTATHRVRYATQSGPLLLQDGVMNSLFTEDSKHRKVRSGVGILGDKIAVFVKSNEPVSFYEFAAMFRDHFGCQNALYLDGVISNIFIRDFDPVPFGEDKFAGMIAVVEKRQVPVGIPPNIDGMSGPAGAQAIAPSDNPAGMVEPDTAQ